MLFRRTPQFREDYKERLEDAERDAVDQSFPGVAQALQGNVELFKHFHIKKMQGWDGIWEGHVKDNLCFTFHYEETPEGEKVCFFRRVGTHKIYLNP